MMRGELFLGLLFFGCAAMGQTLAPEDEIRKILAERIDVEHQSLGMVVGVIDAKGTRVVSYGSLDKGDKRTLDGDTIFEIGSITKMFVALLLSDMAHHGEVALNDPVSKYLPKGVTVPERGGRAITLADLATHTSGLPRLPSNMKPKDPFNPYADYIAKQLYEFLSKYELTRDPGSTWEYSNLGFGLLGQALSLRAGMSFEDLVKSRITTPLKMESTFMTLTPKMQERFSVGHTAKLLKAPYWDFDVLAGAGALRSTADDLLKFLAADLGYAPSPLAPSMAAMLDVRRPTTAPALENALGWQVQQTKGHEIVWKDGGTYGFSSFLAYDPKARTAVIVLSNAFTMAGVADIAMHVLVPEVPVSKFGPPKEHKEIPADPKLLDRYTGQYELAPKFILTVTRDGDHLFAQATGQAKFELFAEGEREFFAKITDLQITFEAGEQGPAKALVLHQLGHDTHAARVE